MVAFDGKHTVVIGGGAAGAGVPKRQYFGPAKNIMADRTAQPYGELLLHVGYFHAPEGEQQVATVAVKQLT